MLQRTSSTPTGPRNGPSGPRRTGGGIQKRGKAGAPVRVDKDGDLVMDAMGEKDKSGRGRIGGPASSRGATNGRGSRTPGKGHPINQQAILKGMNSGQASILESRISRKTVLLKVDGLKSSKAASNSDGGVSSLLGFLERKAKTPDQKSKPIKIKKSYQSGDSVIIAISEEDSEAILKLNNFVFAGSALSIEVTTSSSSALPSTAPNKAGKTKELSDSAKQLQEKVKAVLSSRYNVELKLLNLSSLGQDPGLQEIGIFEAGEKTVGKLFPVIMTVCDTIFTTAAAKRDAIVSITLTDNNLVNLLPVTMLAQTFPEIKNLDLSRNSFQDIRSLDAWRWKFRKLENLVLSENPIDASTPDYKETIVRWYPRLMFLNGTQVRTPECIEAAAAAARSPIPIQGPDFRDSDQVAENFIRSFLPLYDSDRNTLVASVYDSDSTHSIAVDTKLPKGVDITVPIAPWGAYLRHSRNLKRISHVPAKMSRTFKGVQAIQDFWLSLPATRHPDLTTQPEKYLFECHALPGLSDPTGQNPQGVNGLIITMHGEFEENSNLISEKALRSFSRTLVLAPGRPGGPQIRVVSDMLTLKAWAPLATSTYSQPQAGQGQIQAPISAANEQQQKEMVARLVDVTRMTPAYAELCLKDLGWDFERAFEAFNANKAALPADAFLPGTALGLAA